MKAYEITAAFFYGGTDETDDRVIWVLAENDNDLPLGSIEALDAKFWGEIDHVRTDTEEAFLKDGGDYILPRDANALLDFLTHLRDTPPVFTPELRAQMLAILQPT